ncbi:hypothetical protein OKW51_000118 [Pseudomonas hunanensis]|nr:hypothetical protein [Pseudomonas hunanensis]
MVGLQRGKAQGEAIGRMRATLQLALVAHLLEHAQGVVLGTGQVWVGLARQVQAEPLAGQGLAVLEAGIADGTHRHAGGAGQAASRLLGVEVTLLDPQPQVLALAGQRDIEDFIDLEVFSHRLEHRGAQDIARGPRA